MRANETLKSEHRLIEQVQAAQETGTWLLAQDPTFEPEFFVKATVVILGFRSGCHHEKEEGIMFKTMVENGIPLKVSPVAAMLHEHDVGRSYTRFCCAAILLLPLQG